MENGIGGVGTGGGWVREHAPDPRLHTHESSSRFPAIMRYSPAYYDAGAVQTTVFKKVFDEKTSPREVVQCAETWMKLERFRREMRGIPPLATASLKEVKALLDSMKRARPAALYEPVEVESAEA